MMMNNCTRRPLSRLKLAVKYTCFWPSESADKSDICLNLTTACKGTFIEDEVFSRQLPLSTSLPETVLFAEVRPHL